MPRSASIAPSRAIGSRDPRRGDSRKVLDQTRKDRLEYVRGRMLVQTRPPDDRVYQTLIALDQRRPRRALAAAAARHQRGVVFIGEFGHPVPGQPSASPIYAAGAPGNTHNLSAGNSRK